MTSAVLSLATLLETTMLAMVWNCCLVQMVAVAITLKTITVCQPGRDGQVLHKVAAFARMGTMALHASFGFVQRRQDESYNAMDMVHVSKKLATASASMVTAVLTVPSAAARNGTSESVTIRVNAARPGLSEAL